MKKIVAVFLLIAIVTVFVSCGKGDENTTTMPQYNGNIPVESSSDTESTTAPKPQGNGYILTTSPYQTVPSGVTTAFYPTVPTSFEPSSMSIPAISDVPTTPVSPNFSQASTTAPTVSNPTVIDAPDNTTAQNATTTTTTTEAPVKEAKVVATGSSATLPGGDIEVEISANGWDSAIVSSSATATVSYGGKTESASCSVSGNGSGGVYTIVVYTSELGIYSGASVTISFPEGFIKTASGAQYGRAFSKTHSY